ncbi:hypothetical protein KS4_30810 [Poriferisphaera corsica]|uniref:Uncharacterized protein n=1 Tax=Poriferisphaera corsica TaxID=2528020 RepID=A0A517YXQ1_9BACT|nr:hypothetical protein KS4_30810 [Poriferisphaera corsica]
MPEDEKQSDRQPNQQPQQYIAPLGFTSLTSHIRRQRKLKQTANTEGQQRTHTPPPTEHPSNA